MPHYLPIEEILFIKKVQHFVFPEPDFIKIWQNVLNQIISRYFHTFAYFYRHGSSH